MTHMANNAPKGPAWYVYIVRCADDTLYTGITTDLQRRVDEHNHGVVGAKYTRARRPVEIVYKECVASRSQATRREYQIKRMRLASKLKMIANLE
jgi:putative endonuclease